ncbi:MAG: hypothetical protein WCZ02_09805, partial [Lysobacterales bacterium]
MLMLALSASTHAADASAQTRAVTQDPTTGSTQTPSGPADQSRAEPRPVPRYALTIYGGQDAQALFGG